MTTSTSTSTEKGPTAVVGVAAEFLAALSGASGDPAMGVQQVQLLLQLYLHNELSQIDLPRYTGVEKSANSRNVAKLGDGERPLVRRGPGWVEAYEDPADRRHKLVRLTPLGRNVVHQAAQRASRVLPRGGPA